MAVLKAVTLSFLLVSCISLKTQSQIQKERAVQGLPTQVEQSQKLMAQMTLRMNELENRIQSYTGEMEEIEYRQQKLIPQTQKEIQDKLVNQSREIQSLRSLIQKNQKENKELKSLVESQKSYIQKVSKTLAKLSKQPIRTTSASQKKSMTRNTTDFKKGIKYYSQKKYRSAKNYLLSALKNERLNAAEKNQVYQRLGHIEFSKKNYNQSSVYFSKIFSRYPKSSMAPDALIHMARAFKAQKKSSAAKEAYRTFIRKYPKNRLFSQAKKELNAL